MDILQAIGLLIAGKVNLLLSSEEGCCNICCGPCAALRTLRDKYSARTSLYVTSLNEGGNYSWQHPNGKIDWEPINAAWAKWPGCTSVNGVYEKCEEFEDA